MKIDQFASSIIVWCAGGSVAFAGITYSDVGSGDQARSQLTVDADGNPALNLRNTVATGFNLLGPMSQTFDMSLPAADLATIPVLESLTGGGSLTTVASDSEYSLDWNFDVSMQFSSQVPAGANVYAGHFVRLRHYVHLEAGQEYEISWSGNGSSQYTSPLATNISDLIVVMTAENDTVNDLRFGFNSDVVDITAPFTFSFTPSVDENIFIDLAAQNFAGIEDGFVVDSAWASQSASFSIRAIPSPAGVAVFGIAGLGAMRRRR